MIKISNILKVALVLALTAKVSATNISYLNIEEDSARFSLLEGKSSQPPACALAATSEQYAVSLNTEAGRAMYSLLVTALASEQTVSVTSAGDCKDIAGIERATSVSISPKLKTVNGDGQSLYLYKGDEVTKLGRVISATANSQEIIYKKNGNDKGIATHSLRSVSQVSRFYFLSSDCSGNRIFLPEHSGTPDTVWLTNHKDKGVYKKGSYRASRMGSMLDSNLDCRSGGYYKEFAVFYKYQDALCGEAPCILKEE